MINGQILYLFGESSKQIRHLKSLHLIQSLVDIVSSENGHEIRFFRAFYYKGLYENFSEIFEKKTEFVLTNSPKFFVKT